MEKASTGLFTHRSVVISRPRTHQNAESKSEFVINDAYQFTSCYTMNNFLRIQSHMNKLPFCIPYPLHHTSISAQMLRLHPPPIPTSLYYRKKKKKKKKFVMSTVQCKTTSKPNFTLHFSVWKSNRCKKIAKPNQHED